VNQIQRSALVGYSAMGMYDLVNDIESYPTFMTGCVGAEVLARGESWVEARLDLKKAGFTQSFVSRNTLDAGRSIKMELVSGPFKKLSGVWLFSALESCACKVEFTLEYEFSSTVLAALSKNIFEQVAADQVQCLCARAKQIYG